MNISLTWANYALIAGVCITVYYIVIGFVYYRKDLLRILQSKKESALYIRNQQPTAPETENYQNFSIQDGALSDNTAFVEGVSKEKQPTIEDFMDEIYAYTQACGSNITKEELGINLRNILHKYPALTSSSLRSV